MSVSNHGDAETIRRFMEQMEGKPKREYPAGRMGHDDDGVLSYAVAADRVHNKILVRFGKPVEWIGLGRADTEQLIDCLQQRLNELATGDTIPSKV